MLGTFYVHIIYFSLLPSKGRCFSFIFLQIRKLRFLYVKMHVTKLSVELGNMGTKPYFVHDCDLGNAMFNFLHL